VRVLVADDQTAVREGLVLLLGLLDGVELVGAARDGQEAVDLSESLRPDVVLMDLRMPRVDGVEATKRILALPDPPRVLVLTTYADDNWLLPALRAGARGYLTKDAGAEDIAQALRAVSCGRTWLDAAVQERLVAFVTATPEVSPLKNNAGLTERETEVLGAMARGAGNRDIARTLFISEATVKTHVNNIFGKLGVSGPQARSAAVAYAWEAGITLR
jgi:DNA-binding NarL/FixJ family response regulator